MVKIRKKVFGSVRPRPVPRIHRDPDVFGHRRQTRRLLHRRADQVGRAPSLAARTSPHRQLTSHNHAYTCQVFDPRHLRVLAQIARCGTYSAAADALSHTQPAISYHMRIFERSAGTALVVKTTHKVLLTHTGHALADHGEVVLAAFRAAEEDPAALTTQGGGQVRLSAFHSGWVSLVPAALGALRPTHPDPEVIAAQVECAVSGELLLAWDVDLELLSELEGDPIGSRRVRLDGWPHRMSLLSDRRCVLPPADHPAAAAAGNLAPAHRQVDERLEIAVIATTRPIEPKRNTACSNRQDPRLDHSSAWNIGTMRSVTGTAGHGQQRTATIGVNAVLECLWPISRRTPSLAFSARHTPWVTADASENTDCWQHVPFRRPGQFVDIRSELMCPDPQLTHVQRVHPRPDERIDQVVGGQPYDD